MTNLEREYQQLSAAFSARSMHHCDETCPPSETIYAAVAGELSPANTRDMVEHVARCSDCEEAWRLAKAIFEQEAANNSFVRDAEKLSHRSTFSQWATLHPRASIAASILLCSVIGFGMFKADLFIPQHQVTLRDGSQIQQAIIAESAASLTRERFILRWSPADVSARYNVRLTDASLTPIWSAMGLSEPSAQVPSQTLANITAGSSLFWQVDVIVDGRTTTSSPTFIVQLID